MNRPADDFDERPTGVVLPGSRPGAPLEPVDSETSSSGNEDVLAELHAVLARGERAVMALYDLPDTLVVGRGSNSDWQLDDSSLSRRHAVFHWDGQMLEVEDLSSTNGTRLGDRQIRGRTPVPLGATVYIGRVAVTLLLPPPGERMPTPGDPDKQITRVTSPPALSTMAAEPAFIQPRPTSPSLSQQAEAARAAARSRSHGTGTSPRPRSGPGTHTRPRGEEPTPLSEPITPCAEPADRDDPPALTVTPRPGITPAPEAFHAASVAPESSGDDLDATDELVVEATEPADEAVAIFQPVLHRSGPDDETAPWDLSAVLFTPASERLERTWIRGRWRSRGGERSWLGRLWRSNRRVIILTGATLWMTMLLVVLFFHERSHMMTAEDVETAPAASPAETHAANETLRRSASPEPTAEVDPPSAGVGADPGLWRDHMLTLAITAYSSGHVEEALSAFSQLLAADPNDSSVRFMVELLSHRVVPGIVGPPPGAPGP